MAVNRRILLRARPEGRLADSDFEHVTEPVPDVGDGDALIRTQWISLDPTNRMWMGPDPTYLPPVPLGGVVRGLGLGQVVSSRSDDYPEGALVVGLTGWQDYLLVSAAEAKPQVLPAGMNEHARSALGLLGHTGQTAYFGLMDIGRVKEGETVVVSAAAGAVGTIAGQIVTALGGRAVGLAGTDEKCRMLTEGLGFAAAVNYKADDWREQLKAATPDGIDVNFENVGGEIMDFVISRMNLFGRVVLCGLISQYNDEQGWNGSANFDHILVKRLTVSGFIVLDHMIDRGHEAIAYLSGLVAEDRLKAVETIDESGLEHAPRVLNRLYDGDNVGKLLLKVGEAESAEARLVR